MAMIDFTGNTQPNAPQPVAGGTRLQSGVNPLPPDAFNVQTGLGSGSTTHPFVYPQGGGITGGMTPYSAPAPPAPTTTMPLPGGTPLQSYKNPFLGSAAPPSSGSPSGAPAGGNFRDPAYASQFVSYYANQPGANPSLKNDPNYWIQKIASGELGSDPNYIIGKFMTPEGAPAGGAGSSSGYPATPGYPGSTTTYPGVTGNAYTDPATQSLQALIQAQIASLNQPYQQTMPQVTDLVNQRIASLQQPVWNADANSKVQAGTFNDLEAQRTAELNRTKQQLGAMGYAGTSGPIAEALNQINLKYDQLRANALNQMGTYQVSQNEARQNQAVDLGTLLQSMNNQNYATGQQRNAQAVALGTMLRDFPRQDLAGATQAYQATNPTSSAMGSLLSLLNSQTQQSQYNNGLSQQYALGLGQLLGGIDWTKIFG
jgi:hypothetical protein